MKNALVYTLLLRFLWQWHPSLWTCLVFWCGVAYIEYTVVRKAERTNWASKLPCLAGAAMNAAVTIANGGRMPFLGAGASVSVWVVGTGRRLLFLCDRFPAFGRHPWAIFSVGDFFIIGGIVLAFVFPLKSENSSSD